MKNKATLIIYAVFIILLTACQNTNRAPSTTEPQAHAVDTATEQEHQEYVAAGDSFPLNTIIDIDGNSIDLQRSDKKKLVILFATWCPDSNRLLKALNTSPILTDENIEVIAISREEDSDIVEAWAFEHDINIPLALDVDRSIFLQFASGGIPRMITVSRDNKIIKMSLEEGEEQLSHIQW